VGWERLTVKRRKGKGTRDKGQETQSGIWWQVLLVVLAGLLTYSNALSGPFIFDDFGTIVRNPHVRELWRPDQVLLPPAHTAVAGRPLVHLSFAINYAVAGLDVTGYHVVNVALHLLCGLLLLGLVRRSLDIVGPVPILPYRSRDVALAVALLWTVHPLNSEAVNYVTQRTELMMALCYLMTLYASVRALRSPFRSRWQAVAAIACAVGAACKETIATAPLLVVLYDRCFVFGTFTAAFRDRWRFYGALAASWLILAVLVATNGQTFSAGFATAEVSPRTYLLNQPPMLVRYLWLSFWPQSLVLYYGWARVVSIADIWLSGSFIVVLLLVTVIALIRRPRLGFLCAWVFVTLAPSSSVIPVATEAGAERRAYLALAAIVMLAVIGAGSLLSRFVRRSGGNATSPTPLAATAVVLIVAALLAARTMMRNREYTSALTLAQSVLERWPTANAHYLVGTELAAAGRQYEGIAHLRQAVGGYPPGRYDLGSELLKIGKLDEGIEQLQMFVRDESGLVATRSAYIRLGRAFEAKQDWAGAIEQFRKILLVTPADAEAHGLLADALAGQQTFAEAIPHYRRYLEAFPNDGNAWTGLGVALIRTSNVPDSVAAFRRAVHASPENNQFRLNLARALLDHGNLGEALQIAQQAAAAAPNDPAPHDVLGRVLLAQGKLDTGRQELERSLRLDPTYAPAVEALRGLTGGR
jgi:protein O-mannosyl-transferase